MENDTYSMENDTYFPWRIPTMVCHAVGSSLRFRNFQRGRETCRENMESSPQMGRSVSKCPLLPVLRLCLTPALTQVSSHVLTGNLVPVQHKGQSQWTVTWIHTYNRPCWCLHVSKLLYGIWASAITGIGLCQHVFAMRFSTPGSLMCCVVLWAKLLLLPWCRLYTNILTVSTTPFSLLGCQVYGWLLALVQLLRHTWMNGGRLQTRLPVHDIQQLMVVHAGCLLWWGLDHAVIWQRWLTLL